MGMKGTAGAKMGESALLILRLWEPYHNDAVRREKNETTAHRMADREQDRENSITGQRRPGAVARKIYYFILK
jgi:hypothetical protein